MRLVAKAGLIKPSQAKALIQMFTVLPACAYHDLEKLAPFSASYQERLEQHQSLEDNEQLTSN